MLPLSVGAAESVTVGSGDRLTPADVCDLSDATMNDVSLFCCVHESGWPVADTKIVCVKVDCPLAMHLDAPGDAVAGPPPDEVDAPAGGAAAGAAAGAGKKKGKGKGGGARRG